jgi:hypothetical protein
MDTLVALFPNQKTAEDALAALSDQGFGPSDISVIVQDNINLKSNVVSKGGSSVMEGAFSGATTGGVIGGIAGLLVGLGAIAVPGIGALFIAGPLAAALGLTGAAAATVSGAATGALAGGLVGALAGLGLPKDVAKTYEDKIKTGGVVLAVSASGGDALRVRETMKENGAEQVQTIATA